MNDDELRSLIRAAIQKHMGGGSASDFAGDRPGELRRDVSVSQSQPQLLSISFDQYHLERATDDTTCLIEPAVQCNHCGFCKCHGH